MYSMVLMRKAKLKQLIQLTESKKEREFVVPGFIFAYADVNQALTNCVSPFNN